MGFDLCISYFVLTIDLLVAYKITDTQIKTHTHLMAL
jgi:hypothetical protein